MRYVIYFPDFMLLYSLFERSISIPRIPFSLSVNEDYVRVRLIPCQAAATPMTRVPAIAIALGPLVLLNIAPATNPERYGVTECGTGVHASNPLPSETSPKRLGEGRHTH
jgi:hypothetical protein